MNLVKVTVYIGHVKWAYFKRPERDSHRGGFYITSRAKVCPGCLSVWARLVVEGDPLFTVESHPCADWDLPVRFLQGTIPGSLLDDRSSQTVDMDLLDYLPPNLLEREYQLHLKYFDKVQSEQSSRSSSSLGNERTILTPRSECPS